MLNYNEIFIYLLLARNCANPVHTKTDFNIYPASSWKMSKPGYIWVFDIC